MSTTRPFAAPRRTPPAAGLGLLVPVVLVAVAVVGVHDLSVTLGWSSGSTWVASVTEALDGLGPSIGLTVLGAALALLGLVVVLVSLTRGRPTHAAVTSDDAQVPAHSDLWLTPGAIGAIAHELADRSTGVLSTETTRLKRRRVVLRIEDQCEDDAVLCDVQARLDSEVGSLTAMKVVVRRARRSGSIPTRPTDPDPTRAPEVTS